MNAHKDHELAINSALLKLKLNRTGSKVEPWATPDLNEDYRQNQSVSQSVVYSFSMHKKRHTMTSVKAEQCETTVYAYCG